MEDVMLSIRMITYNQEQYIAKAIESVLKQKVNFRYELLIGDDASTDNTSDITDYYRKKYPEIIKVFHRKKNMGYRANGQAIINCCRGKYVTALEGDDYWEYDLKLQKQVDYLECHKDVIAVAHNVRSIDKNGGFLDERYADFPIQSVHVYNKANAMKCEEFSHASTVVHRNLRYLLNERQWAAYEKCDANNDFKMWLTIGMLGNCIHFENVWSCKRVAFEGNSCTALSYQRNILGVLFEQYCNVAKYLKEAFGVEADISEHLLRLIRQAYDLCYRKPTKQNMVVAAKISLIYMKMLLRGLKPNNGRAIGNKIQIESVVFEPNSIKRTLW